jgi:hypothetical protein
MDSHKMGVTMPRHVASHALGNCNSNCLLPYLNRSQIHVMSRSNRGRPDLQKPQKRRGQERRVATVLPLPT